MAEMVKLACPLMPIVNQSMTIRDNVLDTLELIASKEKQQRYQNAVPHVDVPAELFKQWEDAYFPADTTFKAGFDATELRALERFDGVFNEVCDATPSDLPALEDFVMSEPWRRLASAAIEALKTLRQGAGASRH
jgi:hypothetical protein